MQVFWAQKCKSVFIQNQPQFGKFLNKDLNLIRIKIDSKIFTLFKYNQLLCTTRDIKNDALNTTSRGRGSNTINRLLKPLLSE